MEVEGRGTMLEDTIDCLSQKERRLECNMVRMVLDKSTIFKQAVAVIMWQKYRQMK